MKTGEDLVLQALKREFTRLSRIAEKAKAQADEHIGIGSEYIDIHKELHSIVSSKEHGKKIIKRLDALQVRRDKADRVMKKDSAKLFDRQHEAEHDRDSLGSEISMIEFRKSLREGRG